MNFIDIVKTIYVGYNSPVNIGDDDKISLEKTGIYVINPDGKRKKISGNYSDNKLLEFCKYQAPYLNTKISFVSYSRPYLKVKVSLEIKNNPYILEYLNHDLFLRDTLLADYHYSKRRPSMLNYNKIQTPIYKSKIDYSSKIPLFDYQKNNIEQLFKLSKNPIELKISDIKLSTIPDDKYPDLDSEERTVYFDNYEELFTYKESKVNVFSKGAVLADEMGLGKTITMISFLKYLPEVKPVEKELKAKGHLIIVPSHLAKQWKGEIEKVWPEATIKLILTKRDHLGVSTKEILNYDFVIVTQQFLVNKNHYLKYPDYYCTPSTFRITEKLEKCYDNENKLKVNDLLKVPPIFEVITWNNLVLDEAHEVMNGNFGSSASVSCNLRDIIKQIQRSYNWYISGTPYNEYGGLENIFNYLNLKIKSEFSDEPEIWSSSKYEKILYGEEFLRRIVLRHSKKQVEEQLNLKGLDEEVYWLDLTDTERQIYNGSKNRGRSYLLRLCCHLMVADYNSSIKIQTVDIEEVKGNIIKQAEYRKERYEKLLAGLNPLNQSYHMLKANYTGIISQAKFMLESIKKLTNKEEKDEDGDIENEECPICIDDVEEPTILPCGHIFCYECISEMTKVKKECPMCKQQIKGDLIKVADKKEIKKEKKDELVDKYGVKTGSLIRLVRKITSNSENNVIIFSQYDFMLKLISNSLSENGVSNSFVKGNVFQRNKAIETFKGLRMGSESKVIMLSLQNAASGTHLVEANHIIFVDPVDSYRENVLDIENQAIARAFRIGQKKKVHIHRLLTKNTVEEDIYKKVYL